MIYENVVQNIRTELKDYIKHSDTFIKCLFNISEKKNILSSKDIIISSTKEEKQEIDLTNLYHVQDTRSTLIESGDLDVDQELQDEADKFFKQFL